MKPSQVVERLRKKFPLIYWWYEGEAIGGGYIADDGTIMTYLTPLSYANGFPDDLGESYYTNLKRLTGRT